MKYFPRVGVSAVLTLTFIIALPALSLAQAEEGNAAGEQSGKSAKDQAREHYAKGKAAFDQGNYTEALKAFQKAYELSPHPIVLKSVGECQARTNDIKGAIDSFERYLQENPDGADAADVRSRVEELRSKVSRIDITTIPDGATVQIDGAGTEKTTPMTLEVSPGKHTVVLTISGFKPLEKEVETVEGLTKSLPVNFFEEGERVALEPFPSETAEPVEEEDELDEEEDSGEADYTGAWICVGIAGAGVVAGGVFGLVALSDQSEFDENPSEDLADSGESMALAADISFGVAGAAAIVGLVLFLTADEGMEESEDTETSSIEILPVATADGAGMAARISF